MSRGPKKKTSNNFGVSFVGNKLQIKGRPPFNSVAKRIKVNQSKGNGHVEDRRHVLHYDLVFKKYISRVVSKLYAENSNHVGAVAAIIRRKLEEVGCKRLPGDDMKLIARLVIEINSAKGNLVAGRADTNKAIEIVRANVRKCMDSVATHEFAEEARTNSTTKLSKYKKIVTDILGAGDVASDISQERSRIQDMISVHVNGCDSASGLWRYLHDVCHSVTFDYSPGIGKGATVYAMKWQKKMMNNKENSADLQLDDLVSIISMRHLANG